MLSLLLLGLAFILLYIHDRRQKTHTILRNFPIIGHFRYGFEYLGDFFRQYFFTNDREELPFDRADRSWIYRASKNVDTVLGFGSTRPLNQVGEVYFVSAPFPALSHHEDSVTTKPMTFGPYCKTPFTTNSLFNVSAMSYGAISKPAILALTKGAKKAKCWVNTGEGGVSDYHLEEGCDIVVQIGTAKYGVRDAEGHLSDSRLQELAAFEQVRMFEIKLSQGAKPGKGGLLPAIKVTEEIARIRGIPVHQDSVSPNRHIDIANVEDLLTAIEHVRQVTGKPVGCKFVLGSYEWLNDLCLSIHKRGIQYAPDFISLDSADGGTGAAPQGLMDYMGIPIQESLPRLVDILVLYNLKNRIRVIASGKLVTPSSVAWALCAGADFVNSARGFLFSLGCIQAMKCHTNECPTGITTHNPTLQRGLVISDKAERVYHYAVTMLDEIDIICHSCGVDDPRQLCRSHVRIVRDTGFSVPLSDIFPDQTPLPEYREK
ncbi:MAG: FMN-binding glutamate synthase family protein [Gammaproteobacteria bacterium]|nr:FMN-binding glutamate synthase family protein [Gammaproteobacteria bacterium]